MDIDISTAAFRPQILLRPQLPCPSHCFSVPVFLILALPSFCSLTFSLLAISLSFFTLSTPFFFPPSLFFFFSPLFSLLLALHLPYPTPQIWGRSLQLFSSSWGLNTLGIRSPSAAISAREEAGRKLGAAGSVSPPCCVCTCARSRLPRAGPGTGTAALGLVNPKE